MTQQNVLNYLSLTVFSIVLSGFGIVTAILLATSIPPTIADFLPLLIAFLLGHKLYMLVTGIKKYKSPIGLGILKKVEDFLVRKKIVLIIVVLIGFVIWFRTLVPPNIVTSALFLFLNPFAQMTLNLSGFLGKLFAELVTLGVQLWFVYLVVDAISSLSGKILKRGRKATKRR